MESGKNARWEDLTIPLADGMIHWPGDRDVRAGRVASLAEGHGSNLTWLDFCAHTGTHVDAPLHYVDGAPGVDAMPPDLMCGPARIVGVNAAHTITAADLAPLGLAGERRVLFRTRNSDTAWWERPFTEDYVHLAPDAAELLADLGVDLVGIDYLSVGSTGEDGALVHRILLSAGVYLVEGLALGQVGPGRYELACLPLRLAGADGAPARVLARFLGD